MSDITFSDEWSYCPPEQPDCLVVPEIQWDKLESNLKEASIARDAALWCLCGICGGGALTCLVSFFAFPLTQSPNMAQLVKQYAFLGSGLFLLIACVVIAIFEWKQGTAPIAKEVGAQMEVLKQGFRRLTSEHKPSIPIIEVTKVIEGDG